MATLVPRVALPEQPPRSPGAWRRGVAFSACRRRAQAFRRRDPARLTEPPERDREGQQVPGMSSSATGLTSVSPAR